MRESSIILTTFESELKKLDIHLIRSVELYSDFLDDPTKVSETELPKAILVGREDSRIGYPNNVNNITLFIYLDYITKGLNPSVILSNTSDIVEHVESSVPLRTAAGVTSRYQSSSTSEDKDKKYQRTRLLFRTVFDDK